MKKILYSLIAFSLPLSVFAQPVLDSAEAYQVGQHFHYMLCSPTAAGPAGAMQSWDFTSIADSVVVPVDVLNSLEYPTYDSINMGGNGYVIDVNDTETTLKSVDMQIAVVTYTPAVLMVPHPVTYLDTASGAFTDVTTAPSAGSGTWHMEADGYGTLKTPQATFDNTLRVKTTRSQVDSVIAVGSEYVDFVSYMWYDSTHAYPLMRIDSVVATGLAPFTNITVAYYTTDTPTAVKHISASTIQSNAHFDNSGLVVKTSLSKDHQYKIALVNMQGQIVYYNTFKATGDLERFSFDNQLPAGAYFVAINELDGRSKPMSIKVQKQ